MKQQTLEEKLENSRIIVISGYIDNTTASKVILKLMTLSLDDSDEEIQLFIGSEGGSYLDVLAIIDTMKSMSTPIRGVCIGMVHGYATLLLASCTKGRRVALNHSEIGLQQPYGMLQAGVNQQTEIAIEAKEAKVKRDTFEQMLAEVTGQSVAKIHADCEVGTELDAQQAKDYGIVDVVMD